MTIEINGMAHVILTVSRFDVARDFYRKLLPQFGMKPMFDGDKFFYCVGGRTAIGIEPCDPGLGSEHFRGSVSACTNFACAPVRARTWTCKLWSPPASGTFACAPVRARTWTVRDWPQGDGCNDHTRTRARQLGTGLLRRAVRSSPRPRSSCRSGCSRGRGRVLLRSRSSVQPPMRLITDRSGNLWRTAVASSIAFCPNEPSPCRQMTSLHSSLARKQGWGGGLAALDQTVPLEFGRGGGVLADKGPSQGEST